VLLANDTDLILAEGKKTHDPTIGTNTASLMIAIAELRHIRCATLERLAKCLPYIFVLHLHELGLTISIEELWTECLEDFEILPLFTLVLRLTLRSNIRTVLRSLADGTEIILAYHDVERKVDTQPETTENNLGMVDQNYRQAKHYELRSEKWDWKQTYMQGFLIYTATWYMKSLQA